MARPRDQYGRSVVADGAIAYWRLDETTGLVRDLVGGYHGTISGGVTRGQPGALAVSTNAAMTFDGSTGKIVTAQPVPIVTPCTIESWFKNASTATNCMLVSTREGYPLVDDVYVRVTASNGFPSLTFDYADGTPQQNIGIGENKSDGQWHCFAVVITPLNCDLYLDGVFKPPSHPLPSAFLGASYPVTLGYDRFGGYGAGSLDEIAIYPSALTASQIANHYALRTATRLAPSQPVRVESRLEFALGADGYFDPAYFDPAYFDMGDKWVDVLNQKDVRAQMPIVCEYGIRGNTPIDRVANAGTLKFALNNSELNSAQRLGYYSLLRSDKRPGFDLNIAIRWRLSCPQVNDGQSYYKFLGTLDEAVPDPGIYGTRLTVCTAVDIFDDYARIDEPDLPLQVGKRFDQLLTSILDGLTTQPRARAIETGSEPYTFALDGGTTPESQRSKVRERMVQLAASEFGYIYPRGDTTGGGTLVGENRHHRVISTVAKFTLDNSMDRDGLTVPGSRRDVYRKVQIMVHPTNDVASAAPIVLWSIQQSSTVVQAGETNTYIFGAYFDPVTHESIGGNSPSPTYDPVATTDYQMNAAQDGSGADLTSSFTVSASRTGLGVRWTVTNSGGTAAFIRKLQIRGIPIYRYDMSLEKSVAGGYGDQVLVLDMPFNNSSNVAQDVATALATRYAKPFAQAPAVRFLANRSVEHMTAALTLEPGDRVGVVEQLTGLQSAFTINGVHLELAAGGLLWCQWYLETATAEQYWLIGIVGSSELGVTTVLGF